MSNWSAIVVDDSADPLPPQPQKRKAKNTKKTVGHSPVTEDKEKINKKKRERKEKKETGKKKEKTKKVSENNVLGVGSLI